MAMADMAKIDTESGYRAGVCNIGPAEIRRRRMAGHAGAATAALLYAGLAAAASPHAVRMAVAVPAMVSAAGYIQARLRFCANYGSRGVFNFGDPGAVTSVTDLEAAAADRRRSALIGLASAVVGLGVGIAAVLLPIA